VSVLSAGDRHVWEKTRGAPDQIRPPAGPAPPINAEATLVDEGGLEAFEERAAIMEVDGGLSRRDAEVQALALAAEVRSPDLGHQTVDAAASAETTKAITKEAQSVRSCIGCQHLTRRATCAEPVAARLLSAEAGFGIAWPPAGHAHSCPTYCPTPGPGQRLPASPGICGKGTERPYRLTPAQGDAAHAEPWDDAAIGRFQARVLRLLRQGFGASDADDLAERLHLRDVEVDDRVLCVECRHYRPGRCGIHRHAGLQAPELSRDMAATLQRCGGFKP